MGRKRDIAALVAVSALVVSLVGCGGGKSKNATGDIGDDNQPGAVSFWQYRGYVERVAPPEYTPPAAAPTDTSDWTAGDYPLLGKVFSSDEPMSLYANLEYLDMLLTEIAGFLQVTSSGEVIADSSVLQDDSDAVRLTTLANGAAVPTDYQEVLGALRIDVDTVVQVRYGDTSVKVTDVGFTRTDSSQMVLTWDRSTDPGGDVVSSSLFYAYANSSDSSVEIRGLFYKDLGDSTTARWVYHIEGVEPSDFTYRMSWYADDFGDQSAVAAIVGGGNKDTEFVLRYRQYIPPTATEPDDFLMLDQTFGPDFTPGDTTISAAYEDYVNETLIFKYQAFPQSQIVSPWTDL